MQWVLLVSIQWLVLGSPPPATTEQIGPFASEELCRRAAEQIHSELSEPIPGQRIQTFARTVCLMLRDKDADPAHRSSP